MKKNKILSIKLLIVFFISVGIPLLIEKFYFSQKPFSMDRFFIFFIILSFIGIHFVFNIKKIWKIIYKRRYIIGLIAFVFLIINGYHGSSIGIYNGAIQVNNPVEDGEPILGHNQVIRGDEYAVSTPFILSQASPANNFNSVNHSLMAQDKSVSFYLRYPTLDTASIAVPQQLPFLFLPTSMALSAYWFIPIFFLFYATFEFMMILTKNKICSALGAMMVTFAPASQWWSSYMIIASGEAAMIMFYQFLKSNKLKIKIVYAVILGIFGSIYIMNMYPAWLVPYGYFFLVIVVWMLYMNRGNYKISDIAILLLVVLLVIGVIIVPAFLNGKDTYSLIVNTVYPGARMTLGGDGTNDLIKYFSNLFLPYKEVSNACEMSQFISFYPLPTIMGIYYSYKNRKNNTKDYLLLGLVILSIFLSIWNFIELPPIIAKLTLLSMSTVSRADITLGFVNIVIMIICIAKYRSSNFENKKYILIVSILSVAFVVMSIFNLKQVYDQYFTNKVLILTVMVFCFIFILLVLNNHKSNKILITILFGVTLFSGITIHPLNKGVSAIYDKPITKEVEKIISKEPKAKWMAISTPYYLQNYIAATGAYMINSTNYFPNHELWDILDSKGEYDNIYNRYAHLTVNLTKDETKIDLINNDHVGLDLNVDKLKDVGVEYILTVIDLSEYQTGVTSLSKQYNEDGIYIYKVN